MDLHGRFHLALTLGPHAGPDLPVRSLRGEEALSTPFRFEVEFATASGEPLDLAPLLATEASVSLARPDGETRWVHGICARLEHLGVHAGRPAYRATLAPKLALLGETAGCRLFQGRSAVEIVKEVLDAGGVAHREELAGASPARDLCLQYRESGLAFVSRLLEEEGIAYWFEHREAGHVMVLCDGPSAFGPLPGGDAIPWREGRDQGVDVEQLTALKACRRVKPGRAALRDYDFERPDLSVSGEASSGAGAEVDDWPAGPLDPAAVGARSRVRLEELRVAAETWEGAGTCARLFPGAVFSAAEHPDPAFQGRLLAVRVSHVAEQPTGRDATQVTSSYRNTFMAVAADRPYRPARRTPRPSIAGVQTATVVGPAGEEIHLDRHGRVKVQFHWDREGARDDRASAWVRTAQAWSGAGFGALLVPRVGQEVLVRFLEGDPDRPLVAGALYNGERPPGVTLPDEKTRSTQRTDSSPHGGGYSELRFEDRQGAEHVHLRAEKDERLETLNDKRQRVQGLERLGIGKDRTVTVRGQQQLEVALDDAAEVGGSQALSVAGDRTTQVFGSHAEEIGGNLAAAVGGQRHLGVLGASLETVGAAAVLGVGAAYAVSVGGAENVAVGGALAREIGGEYREWVGAARETRVIGDASARAGGKDVLDLRGDVRLTVDGDLDERAGKDTAAEAGTAVTWTAKGIQVEAERLRFVVGGKVMLSMEQGGVAFGGERFIVDGTAIALTGGTVSKVGAAPPPEAAPEVRRLEELRAPRSLVEVAVTDGDGKPVANVRVRVELPDGSVQTVRSDGQGNAVVSAPQEGAVKISLPDQDAARWEPKR